MTAGMTVRTTETTQKRGTSKKMTIRELTRPATRRLTGTINPIVTRSMGAGSGISLKTAPFAFQHPFPQYAASNIYPPMKHLPKISTFTLTRRREPFDHPDWVFELKHDGFRADNPFQPRRNIRIQTSRE